jgi:hypothetical protein
VPMHTSLQNQVLIPYTVRNGACLGSHWLDI